MSRHGFTLLQFGSCLLATFALAACTAFLGVDFEGTLRDGDAGGAPADGGEPDTSDATAAPGHCSSALPRPIFCADFDRGELLSEWSPTTTSGTNPHLLAGGSLAPDVALFSSPPRAAKFETPTSTGAGAIATAFAAVDLPADPDYVLVYADLRIDTEQFTSGAGAVRFLELELPGAGAIRFERDAAGTHMAVADFATGTEERATFTSPIIVGRWTTLRFAVHNGLREMTQVSALADSAAAKLPTPVSFRNRLGKAPILRAGIVVASSPVGRFGINFDNVRVDYEP